MLHRRKRPPSHLRIVRPSSEPGAPPPPSVPEDRGARARWAASFGASLALHAAVLAALAWGATTFVRVVERDEPPPVFVTLLGGAAAEGAGGAARPPAGEAAESMRSPAPPSPVRVEALQAAGAAAAERAEPEAARERPPAPRRVRAERAAPPLQEREEPRPSRTDPAPRVPAAAPAESAPAAGEAPAGAVDALAGAEATLAARAPSAPGAGDADRVYGEGEVDQVAAPIGGIRRPEYPARERLLGREGRVSLVVTVGADGAVRDVRVARSAGEAFDASARRAIERTPFRAARVEDRPVPSTVTVDVSFELD